jgi:hypothetical protein
MSYFLKMSISVGFRILVVVVVPGISTYILFSML